MSHTWPNAIKIFDSRFWNGVMPAGYPFRGYIAKATDGDNFTSPEFPNQYRAAERLFGEARGAWSFHRFASNPVSAAARYHNVMKQHGGYGAFPPVFDMEDSRAPASVATCDHAWAQIQEMESLAGKECLIYTAGWIFNRWAPYIQSRHGFYSRKLWEADPEPATPQPGTWPIEKLVMVQVRLDFNPGGFNVDIDESDMDPIWWKEIMPTEDLVTLLVRRDVANSFHEAFHS